MVTAIDLVDTDRVCNRLPARATPWQLSHLAQ